MQYSEKHHIAVTAKAAGAIIYNEYFEILLVQELQGSKKGLWHIPSGSVEVNEFPIEAARREVEEETGLVLKMSTFLNTYAGRFDDGDIVLRHVWIEKFPKGQELLPQLTGEIGAVKFYSIDEILELYREGKLRMFHTKLMVEDARSFFVSFRQPSST